MENNDLKSPDCLIPFVYFSVSVLLWQESLEPGIWNLEPWNLGIRNLEFGTWNLEFGIWNLEFGTLKLVYLVC